MVVTLLSGSQPLHFILIIPCIVNLIQFRGANKVPVAVVGGC